MNDCCKNYYRRKGTIIFGESPKFDIVYSSMKYFDSGEMNYCPECGTRLHGEKQGVGPVYCGICDWYLHFDPGHTVFFACTHPGNYESNFRSPKGDYIMSAQVRNKNNDCPWFKKRA